MSKFSKKKAQYYGYFVFVVAFVFVFFDWIFSFGYQSLIFVPAAFFVGMIGYWLGGFLYSRIAA
ncbi:hypothetical protein J2755_000262 [Methanohalophilus levihalophilus]|uniref:hypothetical protein n=1 Tax=Methanohalophilus levihalophilus TaxID=1431282 RepID=UPI001AE3D60B|nr:hypothetical protein [Methanohalophilus levihalophilus]MBP2029342.1 hypothetical protein [Methanohalophilus levihalophilus]